MTCYSRTMVTPFCGGQGYGIFPGDAGSEITLEADEVDCPDCLGRMAEQVDALLSNDCHGTSEDRVTLCGLEIAKHHGIKVTHSIPAISCSMCKVRA